MNCEQSTHDEYKATEQSFRTLSDIKHHRDASEGINMLYGNCPDCGSTLCFDFDEGMAYIFWDYTCKVYGLESTLSYQSIIVDTDDIAVLDAIPGRCEWVTYQQIEPIGFYVGFSDIKFSDKSGKVWRIRFHGKSVSIDAYDTEPMKQHSKCDFVRAMNGAANA